MKNENKIRAAIREAIKKELTELALSEDDIEEVSTSGGAGGYNIPGAFGAGREMDKKKAEKNRDNSGMMLAPDAKRDIKQPKTVKLSEDKTEGKGAPPAKGVTSTSGKGDQPLTKAVRKRATLWGYELVPPTHNNPDKKLETDESTEDHQSAEEAHVLVPFGKGKTEKLPEHSVHKNIVHSLQEINMHLKNIKAQVSTTQQLKEELNLNKSPLWGRIQQRLLRTEADLLNLARIVREIKNDR